MAQCAPAAPIAYGPLMVAGFLGTLIGLERAFVLNRRRAYGATRLTTTGALLLAADRLGAVGPAKIALGSAVVVAIFAAIMRLQPVRVTATLGLAALVWLVGNMLWRATRPIPGVVYWWVGFLVVTIVGERLELSRLLRLQRRDDATFGAALGLFMGKPAPLTLRLRRRGALGRDGHARAEHLARASGHRAADGASGRADALHPPSGCCLAMAGLLRAASSRSGLAVS